MSNVRLLHWSMVFSIVACVCVVVALLAWFVFDRPVVWAICMAAGCGAMWLSTCHLKAGGG